MSNEFFQKIFSVKNEFSSGFVYKVITIFFIKFKFKTNKKVISSVFNGKAVIPDYFEIGKFTYGFNPKNVLMHSERGKYKLTIGNCCSIAPNVWFVLASDHSYKSMSTYPFKVKVLGYEFEAASKGDIVIKDDVWIGLNSIVLSGVTINQGAVVAAGSVVTKDIPPYAIVGGNPAKVIKYRFEQSIIDELMKFDFSILTEDKIKKLEEKLYAEITVDNVKEIITEIQNS